MKTDDDRVAELYRTIRDVNLMIKSLSKTSALRVTAQIITEDDMLHVECPQIQVDVLKRLTGTLGS